MCTPDPGGVIKMDLDDSGCVQDALAPSMMEVEDPPSTPDRVSLLDLSDDVLLEVLKYCEPRDLKALGFTCPRLGVLIQDRSLWCAVEERSHPVSRARLRWYLQNVLSEGTRSLLLTGYAREASQRNHAGYGGMCPLNLASRPTMSSSQTQTDDETTEDAQPSTSAESTPSKENSINSGRVTPPNTERPTTSKSERPTTSKSERPTTSKSERPTTSKSERPTTSNSESPTTSDSECPKSPTISIPDQLRKDRRRESPRVDPTSPLYTVNEALMLRLKEQCSNLQRLSLEYCNIDCRETKLSQFPRGLKYLSLRGSRCYHLPTDKTFMFRVNDCLPDLEEVDVSDCGWLEGCVLLPLSKLPKLYKLSAKDCRKLGEFIAYASLAARYGFRALKVLDVRGSPLRDSEVSAFSWCPSLEELYVAANFTPHHKAGPNTSGDTVAAARPELDPWETHSPEYFQEVKEIENEIMPQRIISPSIPWAEVRRRLHAMGEGPDVCDLAAENPNRDNAPSDHGDGIGDQNPRKTEKDEETLRKTENDRENPRKTENDEENPRKTEKDEETLRKTENDQENPRKTENDEENPRKNENDEEKPRNAKNHVENPRKTETHEENPRKTENDKENPRKTENDQENPRKTENDVENPRKTQNDEAQMQDGAGPSGLAQNGEPNSRGRCKKRAAEGSSSDEDDDVPRKTAKMDDGRPQNFVRFRRNEPPVVVSNGGNEPDMPREMAPNDRAVNAENQIEESRAAFLRWMTERAASLPPPRERNVIQYQIHNRGVPDIIGGIAEILPQLREEERVTPPDWVVEQVVNHRNNPHRERPAPRVENDRQGRYHVLYVNVGRQMHAEYQISLDPERPVYRQVPAENEPNRWDNYRRQLRNLYWDMRMPPFESDSSSYVTDVGLRRFGNQEFANIVQRGPQGEIIINAPRNNGKPKKSKLRILVCTGYKFVTNASLAHLAATAPDLTFIDFSGTNVTAQGVEDFKVLRPDCVVKYGGPKPGSDS